MVHFCHTSSYAKSTSTTILTQHLANVHKINVKTHREEVKQKKLTDIFLVKEKSSKSAAGAVDEKFILSRRLIVWFCRDLLPFTTVENEGFKDFWNCLNFKSKLPTRSNVSNNALDDMYKVLKENLITKLECSSGSRFFKCFLCVFAVQILHRPFHFI